MFRRGLVAAVLLVIAMPVSGAVAAKKLLVISEVGKPVATGAPANLGVLIKGCSIWSSGTVVVTEAAKDKFAGEPAFAECSEGESASGALTEIQIGANGKVTMKGKISISEPGPCAYTYSKWKGEIPVPGQTILEAHFVEGKLNKKLSSKSCAPTHTAEYNAGATSPEFEVFEEALKA